MLQDAYDGYAVQLGELGALFIGTVPLFYVKTYVMLWVTCLFYTLSFFLGLKVTYYNPRDEK